jgi:hypothetical protein
MANRSAGLEFTRNLIGPVEFSDMSGGLCNAYPAHSINNNQVADCLNARFEKRGFTRQPGYLGISASALFTAPIRGWFVYKKMDGTESYIAVSDKKIYSVNLELGTKTQLATLTSDNKCRAVNYYGKLWIANGADQVKIESDLSVYNIGITPVPSGRVLALVVSPGVPGTLPIGTYLIYVSSSRKIDGIVTLYSQPTYVGSVTLSSPGSIDIYNENVTTELYVDSQVNAITIWMTDANGSTYYYYGNTPYDKTATIPMAQKIITNSSEKNSSLLMYEQAAGNQLPINLNGIYAFDGRLWGWKNNDNNLYYSMKAQNVYDLEKWSTEFHIPTIPYTIISGHGVGADLFANTVGGMYKLPNADVNAKPQPVIQGAISNTQILYFPKNNIETVCEYNNGLFGLTNDGFRIFDGIKFTIDLSKHIKPQIDIVGLNTTNFPPAAVIYRRSGKRTEYHLSYNDNSISNSNHNRKLILNLDKLTIVDNENYLAPWEISQGGFSGAITTNSNGLYFAQYTESSGVIATESGVADLYSISDLGVLISTTTARRVYVKTKIKIQELAGIDKWMRIYTYANLLSPCSGTLTIPDQFQYSSNVTIIPSGGANPPTLDNPALILDFVLPAENPLNSFYKFPDNAAGNAMYLEFDQTANDDKFFIYEIACYGFHERNAFC